MIKRRDAAVRAGRTTVQFGLAESILRVAESFGVALTPDQHVAVLGVLTIVVTWAQNLVEERFGFSFLRKHQPKHLAQD